MISCKAPLDDWLTYIHQIHPKIMDLGLERIRKVAQKLKLLHWDIPVITVGGTNGKGSTIKCLEAIYTQAGLRVACYTSPHLLCYNERFTICGIEAADQDLIAALARIDQARGDIELTYFEFSVLAALSYFAVERCDVILLEVGLGGRLDAVNIIDPDLAIITNISIDHVAWLGDTREKIAFEKAGILRENGALICGDTNPPDSLKLQIALKKVCVQWQDKDYSFESAEVDWTWYGATQVYTHLPIPHILLDNAAAAIAASEHMQSRLPVSKSAIRQALLQFSLPGRCEEFRFKPALPIIYDVSHNADSVHQLSLWCCQRPQPQQRIAVFSALKDKDLALLIEPMRLLIDQWYIAGLSDVERGLESDEICSWLQTMGIQYCYNRPTVDMAMQDALQSASRQQGLTEIVVYGSFHTVAKAKRFISHLKT